MFIKEYRIPLPLTKEEYKIAQLYMIAKKSRQESHGEDSGIEILVNEPYEDGPGPDGKGQYTRKVYHVGSHLPAWVKSLIPKSALSVEEEAWNAYPYTKTRFTCPFVEKFNIEIETYYFDDGGHQHNVFNLNNNDLKQREVDAIDIVNEQLYGADYVEEEDPRKFVSQKTARGPLDEQWINAYWKECEGKPTPLSNGKAIMCAYKLCKVEFRYWGMQSKIEKFIHDVALRKTMLRAHIQAWAWIDEWWGLTIDDIRNIEKETQALLAKKFGGSEQDLLPDDLEKNADTKSEDTVTVISCPNGITIEKSSATTLSSFNTEIEGGLLAGRRSSSPMNRKRDRTSNTELMLCDDRKRNSWSRSASRNTLSSHSQASWRMESIRRDSASSESGDEFFDCQENVSDSSSVLQKWSSLDLMPIDMEENLVIQVKVDSEPLCRSINVTSVSDISAPSSPSLSPSHQPSPCPTTVLILVVHAGSVLDLSSDLTNKRNDFTTFRNSFEIILRQHYSHLAGRVSIKLISAPSICSNGLSILSSLAPYGLDLNVGKESTFGEQVPVGALPILGTVTAEYEESLEKTTFAINSTYQEFLSSEEGQGFSGQVCIIGDSVGGVLCYDALCKSHDLHRLGGSMYTAEGEIPSPGQYCNRHRASTSSSTGSNQNLSHFINPSHLFSTNLHSSLPPEPPPSPTITVSFSDAVKEAGARGAKFSDSAEFSALPVRSDTPPKFPHSCPVTPENPLTPTHTPIRKISDPLVSCQSASCRQRKVSAPPNLIHSDDGSLGDSDLSNPMFHSYLLHRHSQQTNLHPFPSFAPVLRCDCSLSGEEYETFRKSCSGDNRSTSHDCQFGRSVSDSDYHYTSHLPRKGSSSGEPSSNKLEFEVSDFFLFGCPLALVLVYRKLTNRDDKDGIVPRPACHQVYNLFHPSDPLAVRLEPLLSARFSLLPPITIPRYSRYPLGDGQPTHLLECIQSHGNLFSNSAGSPSFGTNRRASDVSILSNMSGMADSVSLAIINALSQRWWGNKRLDYALYCPEGLSNFPSNVLPHLFHASYWESHDVVAFIIRQLGRGGRPPIPEDDKDISVFLNIKPREKWQKKRTSVKLKNIAANHRGYDVIIKGGSPQYVRGRFMYGPLDMVALSGEKVDVHIMMNPPAGDWKFIDTATTEKSGRIYLPIPVEKQIGYGIFPVKMIVRGDHTTCSNYMAVVPPKTECILFSIDGSFTASVSVTGRDPKVRAGAVDVVRHWQELGYLILYITGRPDMQQQKVVSWLAQHNFPHGLVSFADGLTTDPLGHKADYLRGIIQDSEVVIEAAYGSAKDISVYSSIGLKPEQIYIVGKASKKQAAAAQVLVDGYASHLAQISSPARFRPARGNPEMLIPKGFFGLPGQANTLRRRRTSFEEAPSSSSAVISSEMMKDILPIRGRYYPRGLPVAVANLAKSSSTSAKRTSSYPVLGSQPNEGLLESKKMFNHHKPGYKSLRF